MPHHDRRNPTLSMTARRSAVIGALSALAISGCATPDSKHVERAGLGTNFQERGLGKVRPDGAGASAELPMISQALPLVRLNARESCRQKMLAPAI